MIPDAKAKQRLMTELGLWGKQTIDECFQELVRQFGDREAVVDASNRQEFLGSAPRRLNFQELGEEVARACAVLQGQGLKPGDVICMQLPNCVEQFVLYLACARLGLVVSPVPVQYREHELEHILSLASARAVVTFRTPDGYDHVGMFERLRSSTPSLDTLFVLEGPAVGNAVVLADAMRAAQLPAEIEGTPVHLVDANDVFTICWTSGTEARPKGVPRTHNEWFAQGRIAAGLSRVGENHRILNPFPMINMAGFATCFFTWLLTGCTVVQHHPFKLPVFLEQLRTERIDHTVAPPAVLNAMLHNPALVEGIDFGRLNRIGSGAAPLSPWMVGEFERRWGVSILNNYGSNEGGVLAGSEIDVPDSAQRATSFPRTGVAGQCWQGAGLDAVQTRLVNPETGQDINQPGIAGELRFAGPTVFRGYLGDPSITEKAFDERGFYRTGDLFEIAGEQGQYYRYVGRLKDIIIRGGINISTEEIDALLLSHPKVADAAVVGYPDEALGERICAFIQLRPDQTLELQELSRFLIEEKKIAIFKLPERLELVKELPRNPVGKLLKRELRQTMQAVLGLSGQGST